MKRYLINILFIQLAYLHGDTTIVAFDNVHQFFGGSGNNRTVIDTIQFPDSNSEYSEIIMTVSLECPTGGCDPWDRKAKISVMHLNDWFEIGRYVTPYGVECGWSFDVTDYRSLLVGEVPLRSYIDTWVQPGWLVNIHFEFISGVPEYPFTIVRNVWNYDYIVYGDTTNPINISSITEYIPSDAQEVDLRMITTGHGQGNTENAAEFSLKIHDIFLNGEFSYFHNFWRDDCASNDCSPQNGTWQYNRAGFCPGDKVTPQDFDLLDHVLVGDTVKLDYILEDYFNYCSPNNPDCVNGVTCSLCDYNNSGHTEPYYYIGSHLIMHTESYHTNADAFFVISGQDESTGALNIYLENYVPIYGIQFSLDLDGVELSDLNFQDCSGGRAEDAGWTMGVNDSGLVIGLAQGTGAPIPGGEGILTQISWSPENSSDISGNITISDLQISGYFGSDISFEIGNPHIIQPGLNLNEDPFLPTKHELHAAYPNPFNPNVNIPFNIGSAGLVDLKIFDINGRLIETLIQEKSMVPGHYISEWVADANASGVYLYTLRVGEYQNTKKVILMK